MFGAHCALSNIQRGGLGAMILPWSGLRPGGTKKGGHHASAIDGLIVASCCGRGMRIRTAAASGYRRSGQSHIRGLGQRTGVERCADIRVPDTMQCIARPWMLLNRTCLEECSHEPDNPDQYFMAGNRSASHCGGDYRPCAEHSRRQSRLHGSRRPGLRTAQRDNTAAQGRAGDRRPADGRGRRSPTSATGYNHDAGRAIAIGRNGVAGGGGRSRPSAAGINAAASCDRRACPAGHTRTAGSCTAVGRVRVTRDRCRSGSRRAHRARAGSIRRHGAGSAGAILNDYRAAALAPPVRRATVTTEDVSP